jgi:gliding motility-associated-like protein
MKFLITKLFLLLCLLLSAICVQGQVFVSGLSPTTYIDSLIAGETICFSNVQFFGNPETIGYFELNNADSTNLGFNSGIMMATGIAGGFIGNAGFPNDFSGGLNNIPELTNAVPPSCGTIEDGLLLSFDFVPQSSSIGFKYVFASDEYNTYVCSQYNDAFAFLISGPGIIGNQNMALVPETSDPITISTINNGSVGGAGMITNDPCVLSNSQYFNTSPPTASIQFNGFTVPLIAAATGLIPCQTYTLKLMIADYCDGTLSSGVFLDANSFSGGPVESSTTFPAGVTNNTIYESCEPVAITFTKAPSPIESVIPITVLGTAEEGEDFSFLVNSLVFEPNQETYELFIDAYNDDNPNEGVETILLEYQKYCGCDIRDTIKILLQDRPVVVSDAGPDKITCSNEPVQIGLTPAPNYSYSWDPPQGLSDDSIPQPIVNIANIGSGEVLPFYYELEAKLAGCSAFDTVLVSIKPQPIAYFAIPPAQCYDGNSFDFSSNGTFSTNAPTFVWDFGATGSPQSSSDSNPQNIEFSGTGPQDVTLIAIEDGCESEPFENTVVVHANPVANFTLSSSVQCSPAYVTFTDASFDANPLQYSWDFGNNTTSTEQNPLITYSESGNYTVRLEVRNIFGCVNTFEIPSLVEIEPTPDAGFTVSPGTILDIDNPNASFYNFGENADICYYVISAGNGIADTLYNFDVSYTFPDSGNYEVEQFLLNNNGCLDSTSKTIRVDAGFKIFIPTGFSPDADGVNDYFGAFGEDIVEAEIIIFNRWGNVLYRSFDPQAGWDGRTLNGEDYVSPGIYFYEFKLKDKYGGAYNKKGTLSVFRN